MQTAHPLIKEAKVIQYTEKVLAFSTCGNMVRNMNQQRVAGICHYAGMQLDINPTLCSIQERFSGFVQMNRLHLLNQIERISAH